MKEISKFLVDQLISVYESGENYQDKENQPSAPTFRTRMVEGKILVDRWNLISTDIIVNSDWKDFVIEQCRKLDPGACLDDSCMMWGMDVYFSDNLPKDMCIMLSLDGIGSLSELDGRRIAIVSLEGLR